MQHFLEKRENLSKIANPIFNLIPENNRLERIWLLSKIEFKKRYYESFFGLIWALLNPLLKVGVYYFAFKFIRNSPMENFALYLFSGLITWMFFTEGASKSMNILKSKKYLIENIQFNRIDIFISVVMSTMYGFLFNFAAFYIVCLIMGFGIHWTMIYFPILILNLIITTLGFSLILAIAKLYFKDLQHLWAIVVLAGFWTAPIFFTIEAIFKKAPYVVYIHPVSGIMVNLRKVTMHGEQLDFFFLAYNLIYGLIALVVGIWVFNRFSAHITEKL